MAETPQKRGAKADTETEDGEYELTPKAKKLKTPVKTQMTPTITCNSGHIYTNSTLLFQHPEDSKRNIFKVERENESFIYKHVSAAFYDLSQRLANDLSPSRRLRLHTDCNHEESILVYPYFQDTLLAQLEKEPLSFPAKERLKIMRGTGEAIQELHSKGWVHLDIKPDNILLNWKIDDNGNKTVTDVSLGDFDLACRLEEDEVGHTSHAVGNAMWRSPEGQAAVVTRASDIYALGLVYIYTLGGGDLLLLKDYQRLVKEGITPEQEILTRHFCYFGPVSESVGEQLKDDVSRSNIKIATDQSERAVETQPELRLKVWGEELGNEAMDLFVGMMNLDPEARLTIDQVLNLPYWQESDPWIWKQ